MKNTIKKFLDSREITRYRFMKEVGLAQNTAYGLYANPDQLPSSTVLSRICDTYKVQPGELLEWAEENSEANSEES